MLEYSPESLVDWPQLQSVATNARLPQALLLSAPAHVNLCKTAQALIGQLLCRGEAHLPCGQCAECMLMAQGTHPDIQMIEPYKAEYPIKVDQIRDVQQDVHQTPQRGRYRFVVIQPADKMNQAAANALLKVLEEPPSHTHFILLAEQVTALPVTIRSRCQHYALKNAHYTHYLALGELYPQGHPRFQLHEQVASMLDALAELVEGVCSPTQVATRWLEYGYEHAVWFLYLVTAQWIKTCLSPQPADMPFAPIMIRLSRLSDPVCLFGQLKTIESLQKKIRQGIHTNQRLAMEALLLGYLRTS